MPAYKDKERGTWYASFYYTDWKGERKLKKKRGFPLDCRGLFCRLRQSFFVSLVSGIVPFPARLPRSKMR